MDLGRMTNPFWYASVTQKLRYLLLSLFFLLPTQAHTQPPKIEDSTREWILQLVGGSPTAQHSVARYADLIERHAIAYRIDPDWIRAIMIVEARRPPSEIGNRVPPTHIDAVKWAALEDLNREQFMDVSTNIRLCALLLRRIFDRLPEGSKSLRFLATLYA